jgi:shikimate dehydrogenase
MIHLGLIGYPLGHSLSPKLHTAALQFCGLEGDYSLFPVPAEDRQDLKNMLSRVRAGEIQGLNVTIPHKQNVIPFLDELAPTAEAIGAVNTIYRRGNKLVGDNTDSPGFLKDLKRFLGGRQHLHPILLANRVFAAVHVPPIVDHKSSLVLGAGGSARAVVRALLGDGWNVTVAARRREQAEQLADSFARYAINTGHISLANIDIANVSLVVNTTPLGMAPNVDRSPWPADLPFPPRAAIYDLVYNPRETRLVKDACLKGRSARTGLGMLVEQAALSFEIWTGRRPSRAAMFAAANHTSHGLLNYLTTELPNY